MEFGENVDIYGRLATRQYKYTVGVGITQLNDFSALGASYVKLAGGDQDFSVTGFANGVNGYILHVQNATSYGMTVMHDNIGSTTVNRIYCGGINTTVSTGRMVCFVYDSDANRWILEFK
jgi:hypothetical protein